jgi:hypothetical protein
VFVTPHWGSLAAKLYTRTNAAPAIGSEPSSDFSGSLDSSVPRNVRPRTGISTTRDTYITGNRPLKFAPLR